MKIAKRVLVALNTTKIVNMIAAAISQSKEEQLYPIPDPVNRYKTTAVMTPWYTTKDTYSAPEMKCHISHLVVDSGWEKIGKFLDNEIRDVVAWVKNDHLAFTINYTHKGLLKSYFPDFIIRYTGDRYLVLEIKGKVRENDQSKWSAARLWCDALNQDNKWGTWQFRVVKRQPSIADLLWA